MAGAAFVLLVVCMLIVRELLQGSRARSNVPTAKARAAVEARVPSFAANDDLDITRMSQSPDGEFTYEAPLTVFESDSEIGLDEPTGQNELILLSAAGRSDAGRRRHRNEDAYATLPSQSLFVLADGMGGSAGGDVASHLAVESITTTFDSGQFVGTPDPSRPRRGNEVCLSIEAANRAIFEAARKNPDYHGMGTTTIAARFLPRKGRVFIGHVGDSRCYRFRDGALAQLTRDHVLAASGVTGIYGGHLSRVLGVAPRVSVDLIVDKPKHGDVYVLCTDGLSKMISDDALAQIVAKPRELEKSVETLISLANESGGRDNITVILVSVRDARRSAA
jgi:serine/threonine protein phosphatase PrpC